MAAYVLPTPKPTFITANGAPLIGGKLYTYAAGTSTPKPTYSDGAGTVPQTNPVILNARGEPPSPLYWDGSYYVELYDSANNLIYTVDNFRTPFADAVVLAANSTLAAAPAVGDSSLKIPTTGWVFGGFVQMGTGIGQNTQVLKMGNRISDSKLGATLNGFDLGIVATSSYDASFTAKQTFNGSADFVNSLRVQGAGNSCFMNFQNSTGSYLINNVSGTWNLVSNDSITRTSITNGGLITCVSLTQTSDDRKKENWRPLTDAQLSALAKMTKSGVFDWRADSGNEGSSLGGSAQEIRAIVPEAVYESPNGSLSVNYGGLSFAMQQAILSRLAKMYQW